MLSWFKMLLLLFFVVFLESHIQNPRTKHRSRAGSHKYFLTILISALNRKTKQTVSNESRNVKLVCLEKCTRVTVTRLNMQGPSWWMFTTLFWEPIILYFFVCRDWRSARSVVCTKLLWFSLFKQELQKTLEQGWSFIPLW